MQFCQLVIGPPGSGKTTYCNAMSEFMSSLGRKVAVINIDPANDIPPYTPSADISELITLQDVMEHLHLGPNGGLIYCMEYLEANIKWLHGKIKSFPDHYLLIDCPGQVELYTHHNSVKNIIHHLQKEDLRIAAVQLVDSYYCTDPTKFISALLTSLSTMLQIELPHINVLSKGDITEVYGKLQFNIDFYTEVLDLSFLLEQLSDDPFVTKFKKLNEALTGVIEDYGLVSFLPLNIHDKRSMLSVMQAVDKANGFIFGTEEKSVQSMLSCAMGADFEYLKTAHIREKQTDVESNPNN